MPNQVEYSVITDCDILDYNDNPTSYTCEVRGNDCIGTCEVGVGFARGDGSSEEAREFDYPRWACPSCYEQMRHCESDVHDMSEARSTAHITRMPKIKREAIKPRRRKLPR